MTLFFAPTSTQNAVANGDTRTISLVHAHTGESASITFKVNGSYDSAALEKLNWMLRDWRRDEPTKMNPRLFDVVWQVWRETGSTAPVKIMSAYRSPETNGMLRRRSRGVAKNSQHMAGNAMDVHFPDAPMSRAREFGMRLQRGGVGYYPSAGSPFVHLDVGSVRHWPRMSYDQLARLFPDGKTVHLPSNGQPLPGYDLALAEIEQRGGTAYASAYVTSQRSRGLFAFLFGSGEEDEEEVVTPQRGRRGQQVASRGRDDGRTVMAYSAPSNAGADDAGSKTFFSGRIAVAPDPAPVRTPVQRAMTDLPRGETVMTAAPEPAPVAAPAPPPAAAPVATAALAPAPKADEQKLVPTPPQKPAEIARAEEDEPARPDVKLAAVPLPPPRPASALMTEQAFSNVPLPPTRPVELTALRPAVAPQQPQPSVPMPPVRSASVAAPLPPVITQGAAPAVQANVSAYAPVQTAATAAAQPAASAQPRMERPAAAAARDLPRAPAPDLVAARIDRSNFRALTGKAPAARTTTQSALAPTVAPVRQASRMDVASLVMRSSVDVVSSFGDRPSGDLNPSRFTGPAVKPFQAAAPAASGFGALSSFKKTVN